MEENPDSAARLSEWLDDPNGNSLPHKPTLRHRHRAVAVTRWFTSF